MSKTRKIRDMISLKSVIDMANNAKKQFKDDLAATGCLTEEKAKEIEEQLTPDYAMLELLLRDGEVIYEDDGTMKVSIRPDAKKLN